MSATDDYVTTQLVDAMYIVAHPDDSLLFQCPDTIRQIDDNRVVATVHLSAGDGGRKAEFWLAREEGIRAAYALMAGVVNHWSSSSLRVGDHRVSLFSLTSKPQVLVIFLRLPDGNFENGKGHPRYGAQSLLKLWRGSRKVIATVDGHDTYSRNELVDTLTAILERFRPRLIATQDYVQGFGGSDHIDHSLAAQFARLAHRNCSFSHKFVGYLGYPVDELRPNVQGDLLKRKQEVFYAYGAFDESVCNSEESCRGTRYAEWLSRQYIVGSETIGVVADAGYSQRVARGTVVALDPSMSSTEVGDATYRWTQNSGTPVTLSSGSGTEVTFVAPDHSTTIEFTLIVTSEFEESDESVVKIVVI
ncbi:MAG: hypothetical protein HIU84_02320 [Acidobacteria bacterium]|nr:hypothetical protein [Acidobacteriota bacterium]